MSNMKKLIESLDTIAGSNPEQKPGDQVRGTEGPKFLGKVYRDEDGEHPFDDRLVGEGEGEELEELDYGDAALQSQSGDFETPGERRQRMAQQAAAAKQQPQQANPFVQQGQQPTDDLDFTKPQQPGAVSKLSPQAQQMYQQRLLARQKQLNSSIENDDELVESLRAAFEDYVGDPYRENNVMPKKNKKPGKDVPKAKSPKQVNPNELQETYNKPYGVRYKVFAGKEGRLTTKEAWFATERALEKAVSRIENLDGFYEIDGYSIPYVSQVQEGIVDKIRKSFKRTKDGWWMGDHSDLEGNDPGPKGIRKRSVNATGNELNSLYNATKDADPKGHSPASLQKRGLDIAMKRNAKRDAEMKASQGNRQGMNGPLDEGDPSIPLDVHNAMKAKEREQFRSKFARGEGERLRRSVDDAVNSFSKRFKDPAKATRAQELYGKIEEVRSKLASLRGGQELDEDLPIDQVVNSTPTATSSSSSGGTPTDPKQAASQMLGAATQMVQAADQEKTKNVAPGSPAAAQNAVQDLTQGLSQALGPKAVTDLKTALNNPNLKK